MLVRSECQYFLSNLAAVCTKSILFYSFLPNCKRDGVGVGEMGSNCIFWEENLHVYWIIMREWPKNNFPILRHLDNFSALVHFIRLSPHPPSPLQFDTKEYLTCWKIIYVYIKPNWRYYLRKSLQCCRAE